MSPLPDSPQGNVLSPLFYGAGAVVGLTSGLIEFCARLVLLGLHMALANVTCPEKGRSPGGSVQCCKGRQSFQSPNRRQKEQQHRIEPPVPTGPDATTRDVELVSPAPPITPTTARPVPLRSAESAAALAAAPAREPLPAAPAAVVPPAAPVPTAEGSRAPISAGTGTCSNKGATATDETASGGKAVAALEAVAPVAQRPRTAVQPTPSVDVNTSAPTHMANADVAPRPTSSPNPTAAADAANSHDLIAVVQQTAAAGIPAELVTLSCPTLGSLAIAEPPAEPLLLPRGGSVALAPVSSDSAVNNGLVQMNDAVDMVATPPLVSELIFPAVESLRDRSPLPPPGSTLVAALMSDHDEARSESGESGITAMSYGTTNSVDPATGAPLSRRLKAAAAATTPHTGTTGLSVSQRLEEKRQSARRKGAHKAKPL